MDTKATKRQLKYETNTTHCFKSVLSVVNCNNPYDIHRSEAAQSSTCVASSFKAFLTSFLLTLESEMRSMSQHSTDWEPMSEEPCIE